MERLLSRNCDLFAAAAGGHNSAGVLDLTELHSFERRGPSSRGAPGSPRAFRWSGFPAWLAPWHTSHRAAAWPWCAGGRPSSPHGPTWRATWASHRIPWAACGPTALDRDPGLVQNRAAGRQPGAGCPGVARQAGRETVADSAARFPSGNGLILQRAMTLLLAQAAQKGVHDSARQPESFGHRHMDMARPGAAVRRAQLVQELPDRLGVRRPASGKALALFSARPVRRRRRLRRA
jgi:hypothetical protein